MADPADTQRPLSDVELRRINRVATSARMVAALAHELNNSLQVVSGLVELLGDREDIPPDAQARIAKIGGQADKATQAVRQVLTYTREFGPETSQVSLGALVDRVLAIRRYNLGRAGVSVAVTPLERPVIATGDDRLIQQVLLNLVLNAEEALIQQPARELRVTVVTAEGVARIEVADTGHGVPEALVERIFEPFFTTRTDERALGLGLPVARALAAQGGGHVRLVSSRPGATLFVAEWPLST
jgi:signal transduction histidine kinase